MDPQPTPLSYTDMPPGSRFIYEVLPDGIRIERLGWCQGRTIGQIASRLLWITLAFTAAWAAITALSILVLRRLIPGVPLGSILHFLFKPDQIFDYLEFIVPLPVFALIMGNIRIVIEVNREKLVSTAQFFRLRSSRALPRAAIEDIRLKRDVVIIKAKRGHRNIRLAHGNNKAQALWLARTLRHALNMPVEATAA